MSTKEVLHKIYNKYNPLICKSCLEDMLVSIFRIPSCNDNTTAYSSLITVIDFAIENKIYFNDSLIIHINLENELS